MIRPRLPGVGGVTRAPDEDAPRYRPAPGNAPDREKARADAIALLRQADGEARVAILAATVIGPRGEEAARVLGERASAAYLRTLIRHPNATVRIGLARSTVFSPRYGGRLLRELLRDQSHRVVEAAARSATEIPDPQLASMLAGVALRHARSIRVLALTALARLGQVDRAVQTVLLCARHPDPAIREDVATALGVARADWGSRTLATLASDRMPAVRRAVARALGRLTPTPEVEGAVSRLLGDRATEVRGAAREARAHLERTRRAARGTARPR
jgi:HEAT repeat protein